MESFKLSPTDVICMKQKQIRKQWEQTKVEISIFVEAGVWMKQNDQLFFGHRNIVLNGLLSEMRITNTRGTFYKLIQHVLTAWLLIWIQLKLV